MRPITAVTIVLIFALGFVLGWYQNWGGPYLFQFGSVESRYFHVGVRVEVPQVEGVLECWKKTGGRY